MTNYINEGYKFINNLGEEEIIQIPYNINNKLITEKNLLDELDRWNVKLDNINDITKFYEAFTHKSYCKKSIYPEQVLIDSKNELGNPADLLELRDRSYERMEYFGDRVLKLIVSMYLFYRYENENEGFMTRLQTKIEDKTNLALMSKEIGLGKYFIISKHIESLNGRNSERIHEDVFEAFIGALFLSNGFEPCCLLIVNLLETLIDYSGKLYCDNNYKDILLRHHHTQEWVHPKYDIIYFEGPAHKRKYIVGVQKHDIKDTDEKSNKYIGYGIGNSHKEGAQQAAKMALIIYGVLKEDQYSQADIYYPPWKDIENGVTTILSDLLSNVNEFKDEKNKNILIELTENLDIKEEDNNSVYSEKSV
jgi:dsRNA-specific ribonuclease